jgi:predicted membrane channel-forming protein YqfA (hemolysin III family)
MLAVGAIGVVAGLAGVGVAGSFDLVDVFVPISFIGFAACLSQQSDVTERGVIASLGLIAILTIIISGTFAGGGGIGSTTDPKVYALNLHMYAIAGMLAFFAWILAMINTFRIGAWGWFLTSLLLFGVGALMFGLFGPTAEDVRQSRLQRAARRAAGVR